MIYELNLPHVYHPIFSAIHVYIYIARFQQYPFPFHATDPKLEISKLKLSGWEELPNLSVGPHKMNFETSN